MTQFHVDYYGFGDPQVWAEGTLDYARSKSIPIWNADQWLGFTTTRHDAEFQDVDWDSASGRFSFTLTTAATSNTLSILLPPAFGGQALESVQVDGAAAQPSEFEVAGRKLALVDVKAGKHTFEVRYPGQQAAPSPAPTAAPDAPTSVVPDTPTSAAPPAPSLAGVPAVLWAVLVVVVLLVAVVSFLVGRGRSGRR